MAALVAALIATAVGPNAGRAQVSSAGVIEPAGMTHATLKGRTPTQQTKVLASLIQGRGLACEPVDSRQSQLTQDGRSLWQVRCRDDTEYAVYLPAKADGRAQLLKCTPLPSGGKQCRAL